MANKYPYVPSSGPLVKTVTHLRKSFPKEVTADTLRKLGVAPKNESYVINVFRFLGIIDDQGIKVDSKADAFIQHKDDAFANKFEALVKEAYDELFEGHGDTAWKLDRGTLTQFFRTADHTSDVVGTRQASTFSALAALSGHSEIPTPKSTTNSANKAHSPAKQPAKGNVATAESRETISVTSGSMTLPITNPVGLTVRIEVNLPVSGDQETYDRIFRSIRENLIDGR